MFYFVSFFAAGGHHALLPVNVICGAHTPGVLMQMKLELYVLSWVFFVFSSFWLESHGVYTVVLNMS